MSKKVHTNIWSAYGFAQKAGYEGTVEEFEQGLKKSAEAAGNAEESASTASEAATEAEAARDAAAQSAESASTSEGNALEYANSAAQVLRDAQAVAQTVNAKANEAAGSASRAENYAQTATTKASEATAAAGTATSAASSASGSAQAADASATAAAASETNAAASASSASTSAGSASESADEAAASAAAAQEVKDSIPEDYSQLSADVTDLKSQLSNADRKIDVIAGITDNPYVMHLSGANVSYTRVNRIYTNELPIIGHKLTIKTSNDFLFAPLQRDNTNTYSGWTTEYTATPTDLFNGLMLWIKKADGTDFATSEYAEALAATTIEYYLDIKKEIVYVAVDGNDTTGDGKEATPYATINRALEDNPERILIGGGKYKQSIKLPDVGCVKIFAKNGNTPPIFYGANCTEITEPTEHGNGIYKYTANLSQLESTPWIFQDGFSDTSTVIDDTERLPEQKGQSYRCLDTVIKRCTETVLNDALVEIANSTAPLFFYDEENTTLYFKAASTAFSTYPIVVPADESLFTNNSNAVTIIVTGIKVKYARLNISQSINSKICNAVVTGAYASGSGAYTYDDAQNVEFINCEAGMAHGSGGYGDGFNSHSTNVGNVGAIRSGARLVSCWSHDNLDDGYSDHYKGQCEIIGGLYEYNGKGGVTPSYSTNCTCMDVVCRQNYNGFYVSGDGSKVGVFKAFNCVSENNMRGGDNHYHAGYFVNDNDAIFYNCISVNNKTAFIAMKSTDNIKLIDCKSSGDERQTRGSGVFEKIVGTVISD